MILTEADLESWIFHYLQLFLAHEPEFEGATDNGDLGVHCQPSFLDQKGKLANQPDMIIFAKTEYSASPMLDDNLYSRKGYSFWGSSIPIELKLLKTCYSAKTEYEKWLSYINKLDSIRSNHYSNTSEECFPLFVLFCKQDLPADLLDNLIRHATCKNINLIISIADRGSSYYQASV